MSRPRLRRVRRSSFAVVGALATIAVLSSPAAAEDLSSTGVYINEGQGTALTSVSIDGNQMTIRIEANGMAPELPHAQHIHGEPGVAGSCPAIAEADADGDGVISTAEGVGQYGTVKVSLTTEGDTSPDSALAVDRFPVAGADGTYVYERTIEIDEDVAANIADWVVITHGVDLDGSGAYDGEAVSSLTEDLPLEATMPATCGTFQAAQVEATPVGGVAAGAGGTASGSTSGPDTGLLVFGALGVGVVSVLALRRRRVVA